MLTHAFTTAEYRVQCGNHELLLHIGETSPTADASLAAAGCHTHWHILTPCNPDAQPLSNAENQARLDQLRGQLDVLGCRYLSARNSAADGSWSEPGFCLLDADEDTVLHLARDYRQLAVVRGAPNKAPELLWTR